MWVFTDGIIAVAIEKPCASYMKKCIWIIMDLQKHLIKIDLAKLEIKICLDLKCNLPDSQTVLQLR